MKITVCNTCKDPNRTTSVYTITHEGDAADVDLCDEHGKPLIDLMHPEPPAPRGRRGRPKPVAHPARKAAANRRGTQILTLEQIEERKREQARTG